MKFYEELIFIVLSVVLYTSGLAVHHGFGYIWIGLILEVSGIPVGLLALTSAVQQGEQ